MIHHPFGNVWGAKNISAYDGGIAEYIDGVIIGEDRRIFIDDGIVRTDEYNGRCRIRVWTIVVSYAGGECSIIGGGGGGRRCCW
jgi:hypothetical protein